VGRAKSLALWWFAGGQHTSNTPSTHHIVSIGRLGDRCWLFESALCGLLWGLLMYGALVVGWPLRGSLIGLSSFPSIPPSFFLPLVELVYVFCVVIGGVAGVAFEAL